MRNRESEFLRSAGPTDASSYPKETDSMNMKPAAKPSCMKDLPTIPTKPIKKIFNFMVQFDESAIPKAAKPFRVYFGQGDEYLHDSLSKMVRYPAVIYCQWSSSFGQGPNCRKKRAGLPLELAMDLVRAIVKNRPHSQILSEGWFSMPSLRKAVNQLTALVFEFKVHDRRLAILFVHRLI